MTCHWRFAGVLVFFVLFACSPKKETLTSTLDRRVEGLEVAELERAVLSSHRMNQYANQRQFLESSSARDRQNIIALFREMRNALIILQYDPLNDFAFQRLHSALERIQAFHILEQDRYIIEEHLNKVRAALVLLANYQDKDLGKLSWTLFDYAFSQGISPFGVYSTAAHWNINWSLNRFFISIAGQNFRSWLVSPSFDLRQVQNPKFRFFHSLMINRNTGASASGPYDRLAIIDNAFQVMVSTNYTGGNPDDPKVKWDRVNVYPMPDGFDFHTIWSPELDLSNYRQQNVTIAFLYHQNTREIGNHYLSWSIERFELLGQTAKLNYTPRRETLFKTRFNTDTMEPFKTLTPRGSGAEWVPHRFNPDESVAFVLARSQNQNSDAWLISPALDLRGVLDPVIQLEQTVRNPQWHRYELLVSRDYRGGDPRDASWASLDFSPQEAVPEDRWYSLVSPEVSLDGYNTGHLVVALRYRASALDAESGVWQVRSLSIKGRGEEIKSTEIDLDFNPADYPMVGPLDPQVDYIYHSDFSKGKDGFFAIKSDAKAAEWKMGSFSNQPYIGVNGYSGKKNGLAVLFSPLVDLSGSESVALQLDHVINFYPEELHHHQLLKLTMALVDDESTPRDELEWRELHFSRWPSGDNWNRVVSEWVKIPNSFQGKKIMMAFHYRSLADLDIYPNWQIYGVRLKEL